VCTGYLVHRVDQSVMSRVTAGALRPRADSSPVAMPSLEVLPTPLSADSAFYFTRERALRESLGPRGRAVLAAAESLAFLDGAIGLARNSPVLDERKRLAALLEARHFYLRQVLRSFDAESGIAPAQQPGQR
jgi:hypothetical protein